MKFSKLLILAVLVVTSCKKDDPIDPIFEDKYGEGMYIVTDVGVNFYNYLDSFPQVENQIYNSVNNITLNDPRKIKFYAGRAYILAKNYLSVVDLDSFKDLGTINGFINPVDFDFLSPSNRILVADKDDAKAKIIDFDRMEITSDIETGDSTKPVFIISNSYKSFVLNGGGLSTDIKDSTICSIEYKDNLVELADFDGSLIVGDNPNSAIISSSGNLKVLCKGVYESANSAINTQASISDVNQYDNQVYSTNLLSGIYNAQNLVPNYDNSGCFFTAEGGIYRLNLNGLGVNLLESVDSDVLFSISESYPLTDSTVAYSDMLYMNDLNIPNKVYKYNVNLSLFVDTIIVDGVVKNINVY